MVRDSNSRIAYLCQDHIVLLPEANRYCLRSIRDGLHGFHGIQDQVHKDLLELNAIADDFMEVLW